MIQNLAKLPMSHRGSHKMGADDTQVAVPPDSNCNHSNAGFKWKLSKKITALTFALLVVSIGASTMTRTTSLRNYAIFPTHSHSISASQPIRKAPPQLPEEVATKEGDDAFWCDRSNRLTVGDICFMRGDVHLVPGQASSLILYSVKDLSWHRDEIIYPYARKDKLALQLVEPVVMRNKPVESNFSSSNDSPVTCDVVHRTPLLLFSTGGLIGNTFHCFNDLLIPLYTTSRHYNGEVVFGITDAKDWLIHKYEPLLRLLSNYQILNVSSAEQMHCFPEATVGLQTHGDFHIDPAKMATHETMRDFRDLLHEAFSSRVTPDNNFGEPLRVNACVGCVAASANRSQPIDRKLNEGPLQMVIFNRSNSRRLSNMHEVVQIAESEGFVVKVLEPSRGTKMEELYRHVHSADVMTGVHGAALTHILFMRPKSLFIQIVPLGAKWSARHWYGAPAQKELDLQYIEYIVHPEESSLSRNYSMDDLVLTNPEQVMRGNWKLLHKIYFRQDVSLSIDRVKETFSKAKDLAVAFRQSRKAD